MSRKPKKKRSPFVRWLIRLTYVMLVLFMVSAGLVAYANLTPLWASRGRLYDDVEKLPHTEVGLVLGTSDRFQGRENRYFRYRIDAAVEVWKSGKVKTLIVSGDNRSEYYNEPQKMWDALVAEGVPPDRIVRDYAGLRTLDSVVRAKEVFGATQILIISQKFHNERAIYLASANGIEAYGFNAEDVEFKAGLKTKIREVAARVQMWLDVNFLHTKPKHLGDKKTLPE